MLTISTAVAHAARHYMAMARIQELSTPSLYDTAAYQKYAALYRREEAKFFAACSTASDVEFEYGWYLAMDKVADEIRRAEEVAHARFRQPVPAWKYQRRRQFDV